MAVLRSDEMPLDVSAGERRGLAMAIRAEHAQVFKPVIILDAVDVVEMDAEGSPTPIGNSATIAPILKQAGAN